jgi:hypothetical protein
MKTDRDLLLARAWRTPGQDRWLAIDLLGGDRILEIETPQLPLPCAPGAILAIDVIPEPMQSTDGGLRISDGLLWALLDPCRSHADPVRDDGDRLTVETALRADCQRFRRRIRWWRRLEGSLRDSCRALLRGRTPDFLPLLDLAWRA